MRGDGSQEFPLQQPNTKGCVTLGSGLSGYHDTQPPSSCDSI